MLRHIISPIDNLIKIDHNSKEVTRGLFARVCVKVDVSKPLKRKIKYVLDGVCHDCLLAYESIISMFRMWEPIPKFDTCMFNSKGITLKPEKFQEVYQIDDTSGFSKEDKTDIQDAEIWSLLDKSF